MRITVDEAREYFAHPSQQLFGITPDCLPDDGFEYWAEGPICGVFHSAPWPGVWMLHFAAKPEGRGHLVQPAKRVLAAFATDKKPARIIGWTPRKFSHAVALARRVGFVQDGVLPMPDGEIIMQGWKPCL